MLLHNKDLAEKGSGLGEQCLFLTGGKEWKMEDRAVAEELFDRLAVEWSVGAVSTRSPVCDGEIELLEVAGSGYAVWSLSGQRWSVVFLRRQRLFHKHKLREH